MLRKPLDCSHLLQLFLLVACIYAQQAPASAPNRGTGDTSLWHHPTWLSLSHYDQTFLRSYQSTITNSDFFISPQGRLSPEREGEATFAALQNPQILVPLDGEQVPAACRYPARHRFLLQYVPDLPKPHCPVFETFKRTLNTAAVHLVFSSYYPNNPASAFGHTLFRLESRGGPSRNPLLDFAVNFAAIATTENPLLYGYLGLTGGFEGRFHIMPFHIKVREYSDFESRDLWSYRLNLAEGQLDSFIAILFEAVQQTHSYYFLTKNCAYQLLRLLEMMSPELKLTAKLPPWVIPAETLKVVRDAGLVSSFSYRPSLYRRFQFQYSHLPAAGQHGFQQLFRDTHPKISALKGMSPALAAATYDTALLYTAMQTATSAKGKQRWHKKEEELLSRRAEIPLISHLSAPRFPAEQEPTQAHPPQRFGLGLLSEQGEHNSPPSTGLYLEQRFAQHEATEPSAGFDPFNSLEFMRIGLKALRRDRSWHLRLHRLTLVRTESLPDFDAINQSYAMGMEFGIEDRQGRGCANCYGMFGRLKAGVGSYNLGQSLGLFVFSVLDQGYSPGFEKSKTPFTLSGRLQGLYHFSQKTKAAFTWERPIYGDHQYGDRGGWTLEWRTMTSSHQGIGLKSQYFHKAMQRHLIAWYCYY